MALAVVAPPLLAFSINTNLRPQGTQGGEHEQLAHPTVRHAARPPLLPHRPHTQPHHSHTGLQSHAMQPMVAHADSTPLLPHSAHAQPQSVHTGLQSQREQPTVMHALPAPNLAHREHRQPQLRHTGSQSHSRQPPRDRQGREDALLPRSAPDFSSLAKAAVQRPHRRCLLHDESQPGQVVG